MENKHLSSKYPIIYLISEGKITSQNFPQKSAEFLNLIKSAVENQIPLIQIREKSLTARLIFELTVKVLKLTKNSETKVLVNDRADIALAAKADGVHLTSNSISPQIIRQITSPDFIIGVSAHSFQEIELAKQQGADFATYSPIFKSPKKGEPKGLMRLREVCNKAGDFPIIALGGIDDTNYRKTLKEGAAGFAAIRFLNNPKTLRNLREEL